MIFVSGTVSNAVKMMELDNQWQLKKNSGQPLSRKEINERANWTEEQWLLSHFQEELENNKESEKMQSIMNKVAAGKELTNEEISYLEEKNPQALKEYEEVRAEKESYERQLKNCKTQEDVDRLKLTKMGEFAASIRKIASDPYIPKSVKLAMAQKILGKANVVEEVHQEFVRSGQYDALPTEEEKKEESEEKAEEAVKQAEAVKEAVDEKLSETDTAAVSNEMQSNDSIEIPSGGMQLGKIQSSEMQSNEMQSGEIHSISGEAVKEELNTLQDMVESVPAEKEGSSHAAENGMTYEELKKLVVDFMNEKIDADSHKGRKINKRV